MSTEVECVEQLRQTGDFRVLERFVPRSHYHTGDDGSVKKLAIYIDCECTGLSSEDDYVIEIGIVPFEFNSEGKIFRIFQPYNAFQEPPIPIPEEITELTGISDEMVKGQQIDFDEVEKILSKASIIIAHNSSFDRPFLERLHGIFKEKAWGCSISDVAWRDEGVGSAKLDYLAYQYDFFFDGAHRATNDCHAGIHLLSQQTPVTDMPVLKKLLDRARQTSRRIYAEKAPFEQKDVLKARGYRWNSGENGHPKAWWIEVEESEYENEKAFLKDQIYHRSVDGLPVVTVDAFNRYSARV
ncbi:MAG: hypothetical protein HOM11_09500 [Methylococcales bacterium]|jgi:DNA polymerase III subunit epsilon|nr:hypothetical protein [Methylococcales bacterium]MBT7444467.1 hypothetical protein [Methylococcales bacterium]